METRNNNIEVIEPSLNTEETDIDVHFVGAGLINDNEDLNAEFIDLDSDGEIDTVLIDVNGEGYGADGVVAIEDASVNEMDNIQPIEEIPEIQNDLGNDDLNLV